MPTPDPNQKMEDLLRAYARKRREEAGAPFESVARRSRAPAGGGSPRPGQIRRRARAALGTFPGRLAAAGPGWSGRRAGDFDGLESPAAARRNPAICQGGNLGNPMRDITPPPLAPRTLSRSSAPRPGASARDALQPTRQQARSRTESARRQHPQPVAAPAAVGCSPPPIRLPRP